MPYVANPNHLTRFAQGFEAADASGVLFFGSGALTPAGAGDEAHALLHGPGPYTQFDGYRRAFNDGFDTSVRVYLDAGWSNGEGFNFTVAVNDQNGTHRRDFAFHVAMDDGQLMIGVNTGSPATPMTDLELRPHAVITESGWYTLAHSFQANEDGVLEVVLTVIDAEGGVVFTQTISDPSDLIASQIGGNRYGWFTANTVEGGLAIDDLTLTTADTNPFIVKSGRDILATFASFEEALAAVQCGEFGSGALSILETGGGVMGLFGSSGADTLTGGDGDDYIDGRGGNDIIDGGDGYDTVHIASSTSSVVVDFSAGTITHDGEVDSITSVENVTVGEGVTLVTAFDANALPGDVVVLEGGDDFETLNIQVSNLSASDTVRMESAGDTIELDLDGDGDIDLVVSGMDEIVLNGQHIVLEGDFSETGLSDDTVIMNGTGGNDILDGRLMTSSESIEIHGGGGNDLGYGAGGEDLLDGGAGSDNLYGGAGNDTFFGAVDGVGDNYRGEGGTDTVDYSAATGAMNINLNNAASGGGVGTDQLFSIENAIGSGYNDTISGSSVDNRITGGAGGDTINGNGGIDTVVINADAAAGIGVQGSFRITVTTSDGSDVLRNIEFIQFNNALVQVDGSTGNAYAYGADDSNFATENCGASGNVLCNDIEIENETMTVTGARAGLEAAGGSMTNISGATVIVGTYGTLTINADGSYDYEITDESLSAGQFVEEAFTYHVQDAAGQGSDAALVFCVMGSNDAPTVTSATNGTILEDTNASTSGTVEFADVDALDTHSVGSEAACGGYVGEFNAVINEAGLVEWTFDVDPADIQGLAAGQSVVQTYTVSIHDGNGGCVQQDVTVTLTGVNDAPTGQDDSASTGENTILNGSVFGLVDDVDGDDIVSYQLTDEAPAGLTFNDETGAYSFDPGSNFDHLNVGDTATVTFSYTATDENGATSEPSTVTITVNGANDGPVATTSTGSATEGVAHTGSVSGTDADDDAVLTYALASEAPAGLTEFNSDGTYSINTSIFDHLAAGETETVTFDYSVTDEHGASDTQTVVVTVTGTNDVPTIVSTSGGVSGSVTEAPTPVGVVQAPGTNTSLATAFALDRDAFRISTNPDVVDDSLPTLRVNTSGSSYGGQWLSLDLVAGEVVTFDADYTAPGDDIHVVLYTAGGSFIVEWSHNGTDMGAGNEGFGQYTVPSTGAYYILMYDGGAGDGSWQDVGLNVSIANWLADPHGTEGPSTERSADGSFTYGDLDTSDTHTVSVSGEESFVGALHAEINSAGTVEWEWTADESALQFVAEGQVVTQTYTVTVDDGNGGTVEQTVIITITGDNDAPEITGVTGEGAIAEDDAIADGISGTVSFTDVDLIDTHSVGFVANAGGYVGTFSASVVDGEVVWSLDVADSILNALNEGDSIVQSYTVTINDGHGGTASQVVSITINGSDDAPVITAANISIAEDGSTSGSFTAVDPEAEGAITFALVSEAPAGFALASDGSWTFTATDASYDALETGESDAFDVTFTATDATGEVSQRTVTLTVDGVSYAPVAVDVSDTVDEDSDISGSVSATDAEDDAEDLTYELVGEAPAGLTFNPDGTWTFDASSYDSLSGGDSLPVTVDYIAIDSGGLESAPQTLTITVTGANDDPTVDGDSIELSETDAVYEGQVSGDDAEGDIVSWDIVGEAPAGLEFDTDTGAYAFDPSVYELEAGETEVVTFQYTGTDEDGGVSEPATITFTITGVNDAPVAADASDTVDEDSTTAGQVTATDDDSDTVTFSLVGEGPEGLVFNEDGTWTFDASSYDSVAGGDDQVLEIDYVATDDEGGVSAPRTLTITITGSNDTPEVDSGSETIEEGESTSGSVAGTDVDGEVVSYALTSEAPAGLSFDSDGAWSFDSSSYEVAAGQTQTVTFSYTGTDDSGGLSEPGSVTITINGVNDDPIASEDTVCVSEDGSVSGELEAEDADGTVVSWDLVNEAPEGFTWNGDGTWSFDAAGLYDGMADGDTDQLVISYTVTDNNGATSEERTLTIDINGVNDAPVGVAASVSFDEDTTYEGSVSSTDAEGDAVTYSVVGETPAWLTFNSDGSYEIDGSYFGLAQGANAVASFQFVASDGDETSAPQTVSINVDGVNDAPTAGHVCDDVAEDSTISGSLVPALGDEDSDTAAATFRLTGEVPEGLTIDPDTGAWTFDADSYDYLAEGEELTVYATYIITDGEGADSNEGTIAITITGSNDGPVAAADTDATVTEGDTLTGQVEATDVDSDGLCFELVNEGPAGLTFNHDGSYSLDTSSYAYLNVGQSVDVSFTYIASDEEGAESEQRTVTITIEGARNVVTMADGGDSFTGTAADEDITGGDSDDFINAGAGTNVVHGGEGDDQIIAGSGHDELHGDAGDDTLNGGSGDDVLRGGEGNDFVNGGSGDDLVYSDAGDDDLRGGTASNDTISFENTLNGITVNLSNGGFQHTGDGFDMITGFENVIGSAYNDTITGNELTNLISGGEGNDTLNGAGGADLMAGGNGNDWYYVDNIGDVIVDTSGVDRVSTTLATYQLAAELENLYGQSATGHHFTGNDGANTIAGFSGNDVLVGGLGGDTLIGMAGNDIMYGGVGTPNTMIGGAGDDTYYVDSNDTYVEVAGEGTDTVMVSLNTHTARANVENMVFTGTGAFTGVGNALNNSMTGGAGNDTLTGGAGNDVLNGGDGVDIARLSGLASGYSITQEGAGWRVIDTNLGDGDDGNDFLTNIESLRFGNGVTQSLAVAPPAPTLTAKEAGPQVLPTLADDDFVYSKGADLPMVSPLAQAFDMDIGTHAVELASLMPERVNLALHFDADLGVGYGHDHGDHWML